MGHLKNGKWFSGNVVTSNQKGEFAREESVFRATIASDEALFQPEKDRYHLYVSYACPWAHRTLIARKLKKLEDMISVDVVHPDMLEHSWTFGTDFEGATGDRLYQKQYLYQIYQKADPEASAKVTVPVLWDKKLERIVNNESAEIVRIFNTAFDHLTGSELDLYPYAHRSEIDALNSWIYNDINNGVYKTGFAQNQAAYDVAFDRLFGALDRLEDTLENKKYLLGDTLSEADIRLVTTLIRFDPVYYVHFKCNGRMIAQYPEIQRYLDRLMALPAVAETTQMDHIKRHYYYSHAFLNPRRIVAKGPF